MSPARMSADMGSGIHGFGGVIARRDWHAAALMLGTYVLCVSCGLFISRGHWLLPAGLMAVAGVVAAGVAAGRFMLALLTLAALVQIPLGTITVPLGTGAEVTIPDLQVAEVVVPL